MHLFGPDVGRLHDQYILNLSALNALLVQLQLGRPIQYHIYTDRGYTDDTHIMEIELLRLWKTGII
jgi:hypothetical protein